MSTVKTFWRFLSIFHLSKVLTIDLARYKITYEVISLNKRLKELRKTLGLTQQQFASDIGLGKSSIGNIENGIINLTDRNISVICSKYNVNEKWLRTGEGEKFAELNVDEEITFMLGALLAENCSQKKEFIKLMLSLDNEDDWKIISDLAEGLKRKNEKSRD